jgi:hypothetical protein
MDNSNIKYGSTVPGGKFRCNDCGEVIIIKAHQIIPPCPYYKDVTHSKKSWRDISGLEEFDDEL